MVEDYIKFLTQEIQSVREAGLYKEERVLLSPQGAQVRVKEGQLINLCSNNYLGLSNDSELIQEGVSALSRYGYGLSSVRFICGTQSVHKELERKISEFLGTEDTILYSSCFDANTGLFETLLGPEDAIISDALNHASIIDGIRLCKAKRLRYSNNNIEDLEQALKESESCRFRMIATDGVFSMDGVIAQLDKICDLAEKYKAMVMVDDSHAVGFMGPTGRGTHEHCGVKGRIDIITGTLGKALGGASGGYTSGRREVIEWLRQRSRPYLFSNSLAPVIVAGSISVLKRIQGRSDLRETLKSNTTFFRKELHNLGFRVIPGEHPITPVMLGDARLAQRFSEELLHEGVYAIGFSYPVVPQGAARIRTQLSAAHSRSDLERAVEAFKVVGRKLGVIG